MRRKEFLKEGLTKLGALATLPLLTDCKKINLSNQDAAGSTNGSSASDCVLTNAETAGPFPIKNPASLVKPDIRGNREGLKLTTKLTIKNKNTGCTAVEGLMVDIWMCDADGDYSEYGGGTLSASNWLRGRQITNSAGEVLFTTIFPGWYRGRAPHIHVEVLNNTGKSLLVTQIAFPKEICDKVYTEVPAYKARGMQDTTNERDGVFRDGFANEMGTFSGSLAAGYDLSHTIVVSA
jgi:protocatechuate 3,4-dioxygenase beta subunit